MKQLAAFALLFFFFLSANAQVNDTAETKKDKYNDIKISITTGVLFFNTPPIYTSYVINNVNTYSNPINNFRKLERFHIAFEGNVTTTKFNTYSIGIMFKNKAHYEKLGMSTYNRIDVTNNFGIYGQYDHAIVKKWINNHINKPIPYIGVRVLVSSSNFLQEYSPYYDWGNVVIDTNLIKAKLGLVQFSTGFRTYSSKGIFFDAGINFNLVGFVNGNYKYSHTYDDGLGNIDYYEEHKEFSEQLFFADFWRDKKIWKDKLSLCSLTFKVGYRF